MSTVLGRPISIYGIKNIDNIQGDSEFIELKEFIKKHEQDIKKVIFPILNRNQCVSTHSSDFHCLLALAECIASNAEDSTIKTLSDKIINQHKLALDHGGYKYALAMLGGFITMDAVDLASIREMSNDFETLKTSFKYYRFIRNDRFDVGDSEFVSLVKQLLTVV